MSKDRAVFIPWTQAERVGFGNGGFRYLTEQPQKRLGLDHTLSKVLEIENGSLAGRVTGADAQTQAKATHALKHCGLDAALNLCG
jgi:phosphoserine phosphatase